MEREKHQSPNVLVFPWIAQGHVTPYFELAKKLTKSNIKVHFCSSPIILKSIAKTLAKHHPNLSPSINLVELHLPVSPELPPHRHTTTGLPPHLAVPLQRAFLETEETVNAIIWNLKPDLVIYDGFQPWVASQARALDIPAMHLITAGAATMSRFLHGQVVGNGAEFPFPAIYYRDHEIKKYIAMAEEAKRGDKHVVDLAELCFGAIDRSRDILLINSCSEIEGKYIEYLSSLSQKEVFAIGPLIRETLDEEEHEEIERWLGAKEESSCVFVSFGSEYAMPKEEMEEIARGLEESQVNFIWVVKFPAGGTTTLEEVVPPRYLERVKGRGLVVMGWVPQAKILSDNRICAFLSHCGWNSVLESLSFGVPIIALPLHLDQPVNARLIEEIGVGVEVLRGENGEIESEGLTRALRKVVLEKSGEQIKCKARELSENIKSRGDKKVDEAVDKLLQLCKN